MNDHALVLVVEDNEANQLLTRSVLEREGYQVEIAGAADEALEKVGDRLPHLILMDIQLPGQDGLSLTRQLKAASTTANIPIIALTAHAMSGDREATIAAGCAGYITKPIDTTTFADQIREILAQAGAMTILPRQEG
jgi:CheY-like chemotaxis protein